MTLFWLHSTSSFLEDGRNEARSLTALANELTANADKNLPLEYYTRERTCSMEARTGWVEPNLKML